MRTLVTGATGFIGRKLLEGIKDPVVLSRNPDKAQTPLARGKALRWDPLAGPPPREAFDGVEAVIHLAGEPVAEGRWTAAKKRRIMESRKVGTTNLVRAICELPNPPRVLVSASAIGIYGDRGDEPLEERSASGKDFLADVCREWEAAADPARERGVRVVHPRIGIVLGAGGGALAKMITPFKFGLGGRLASGRQWMSWIHVDDMVGMLLFAVNNEHASGAMNAVSPTPLTNADFTRALAAAVHRPAIFPVPGFALRLLLGEFAQILLASQRVLPRAAEKAGYGYLYPDLQAALRSIVE
jgi:uncharacterized protein (TIGR01777 family)